MIIVLVLSILVLSVTIKSSISNNDEKDETCADLVLHHHPLYGFGVYAGRNYSIGEYLEVSPHVVVIEQERFQDTVLIDYVEEVNATYVSIAFGKCGCR